MNIIYIAGHGRSGSTILERVLSSHQQIAGLGEVEYLTRNDRWQESTCACGKNLLQCEYWNKTLRHLKENHNWDQVQREQNHSDHWKPFKSYKSNRPYPHYQQFNQDLFNSLKRETPELRYFIDSSKTARVNYYRPKSLSQQGFSIKLIHLVRDGRGCMWSLIDKGSNRKLERAEKGSVLFPVARSLFSWNLSNRAALKWKKNYSEDYLEVRYEDFVEKPKESLERIQDFLDIDLSKEIQILATNETFPVTHQMAGNRLRSIKKIQLKADKNWKKNLPPFHRALFNIFSRKLAKQFGYLKLG
jgi:hypothetical protein